MITLGPCPSSGRSKNGKNLEKIGKNLEKIGKNLEKIGKNLEKIGIVLRERTLENKAR